MIRRISGTSGSLRYRLDPIMLGGLALALLAGCASPRPPTSGQGTNALTPADRPAPATSRRGADVLVRSIRRTLALAGAGTFGEVLVSLDGLRNHSHASRSEFDRMRRRLAELLSGPGGSGSFPIRFVFQPGEAVDYELVGTSYLMTVGGFDMWELYLSLRPVGESWTVWSAEGPVRMLRQPRRGEPELFPVE